MLKRSLFLRKPAKYDVAIIGGGVAGVAAALRAADYNKKVCLVEKWKLGGADAWNGALQSKTMWEMSNFIQRVRNFSPKVFSRDIELSDSTVSDSRLQETLLHVATKREGQLRQALDHANVDVIFGNATFESEKQLKVTNEKNNELTTIAADYYVIATGSKPRKHPSIDCDGDTIVSSDDLMLLPIPTSMLTVGAGVIGCEFSAIYAAFGRTKVNIIEKSKRLLPNEDEDIALLIQKLMQDRGVHFHHRTQLKDIVVFEDEKQGGKKRVRYSVESLGGDEEGKKVVTEYEVDRCLMSIGRVPNYDNLGLDKCGIKLGPRGGVQPDEWGCLKPHDHIYAVGDATTDIALVSKGEREAAAVVQHMFSPDHEGIPSLSNLSTIMFLAEEVAGVGLGEQQCRKQNISYSVARYGYELSARSMMMGNTDGFCKILVSSDDRKIVLGVRAVGAHASAIIEIASLAVHRKSSVYELAEMATAYPSVAQAFVECMRMLIGRSIFKPETFPEHLSMSKWSPPNFGRGRAYQNEEAEQNSKQQS